MMEHGSLDAILSRERDAEAVHAVFGTTQRAIPASKRRRDRRPHDHYLISMMFQQNATLNARIDDTNNRMDQMQIDMREMRAELRTGMHGMRAEMRADIGEVRTEMREMRSLLLQILERTAPDNPVN